MKASRRRAATPRLMVSAALIALAAGLQAGCSTPPPDAMSRATSAIAAPAGDRIQGSREVLIILASAPDSSTARIARAIAAEFDAMIVSPHEAAGMDLSGFRLVGFGSGIFDQMHHTSILEAAESLQARAGQKAFIFSTSGVSRAFALKHGIDDPHTPLRERLRARGWDVVGEYNCAGFNDNSFLKLFGGMNKGRPNEKDLNDAKAFAAALRS
jgi:hypothetical protein